MTGHHEAPGDWRPGQSWAELSRSRLELELTTSSSEGTPTTSTEGAAEAVVTTHRTVDYESHVTTFGYVVDKILQEVDRGFDGKDHHVEHIEDALTNIAGHLFTGTT